MAEDIQSRNNILNAKGCTAKSCAAFYELTAKLFRIIIFVYFNNIAEKLNISVS